MELIYAAPRFSVWLSVTPHDHVAPITTKIGRWHPEDMGSRKNRLMVEEGSWGLAATGWLCFSGCGFYHEARERKWKEYISSKISACHHWCTPVFCSPKYDVPASVCACLQLNTPLFFQLLSSASLGFKVAANQRVALVQRKVCYLPLRSQLSFQLLMCWTTGCKRPLMSDS